MESKTLHLFFVIWILFLMNRVRSRPISTENAKETDFCDTYIRIKGYDCTEHSVLTSDGFILTLQRICLKNKTETSSVHKQPNKNGVRGKEYINRSPTGVKLPVLFDHAVFMGADVWFNSLTETVNSRSLPFLLASHGFDVWLGNHRGTKFSSKNIYYNSSTKSYWDWSFDELASYDLPVMISHILQTTRLDKIHFVGFNQGAMLPLALGSSRPSAIGLFETVVMIAPTVYFNNLTSPALYKWATSWTPDDLVYILNVDNSEFNLTSSNELQTVLSSFGVNLADLFGTGGTPNQLISNVTGPNCCLDGLASDALAKTDSNWVVAPYRNLIHYQQEIRDGRFQKWDFMNAFSNFLNYFSFTPPLYSPRSLPRELSVMVVNGGNDWWADVNNTNLLLSQLPTKTSHLFLPEYAHLDLMYSKSIEKDEFQYIIQYLEGGYLK